MSQASPLDRFLSVLSAAPEGPVFNPWYDYDPSHDASEDTPNIRRQNLSAYLRERAVSASVLLIAEAPGYQGAKFSGIGMTSEYQLLGGDIDSPYFAGPKSQTSKRPGGMKEPTATIVWSTMLAAGWDARAFVLWNAFAWHPHQPGEPLSNRTPTNAELHAGKPALEAFLRLFPGRRIVAIGRKCEQVLEALGIEAEMAVRHPANGGVPLFKQQIAALKP